MDQCVRVCEPRQRGFCPFEWPRITRIYTEHISWAIPRSWSHWTSKLCQIRCSFTKTPHLGSLTVVDLIRKGFGGFSGPNPGNPASVADFNTRRCMRRCAHQASSSQNFKWPVSRKSNRNLWFFFTPLRLYSCSCHTYDSSVIQVILCSTQNNLEVCPMGLWSANSSCRLFIRFHQKD